MHVHKEIISMTDLAEDVFHHKAVIKVSWSSVLHVVIAYSADVEPTPSVDNSCVLQCPDEYFCVPDSAHPDGAVCLTMNGMRSVHDVVIVYVLVL